MGDKPTIPAVCLKCGKDFLTYKTSVKIGKGKYCSRQCSTSHTTIKRRTGPDHPHYKGGTHLDRNGYVRMNGVGRQPLLYHRWLMEQHLGRKLLRSETIHHINGDKQDNRIENLQILSPHEHSQLHADQYKQGKWSYEHHACIDCGTTKRRHQGKGRCVNCYARHWKTLKRLSRSHT